MKHLLTKSSNKENNGVNDKKLKNYSGRPLSILKIFVTFVLLIFLYYITEQLIGNLLNNAYNFSAKKSYVLNNSENSIIYNNEQDKGINLNDQSQTCLIDLVNYKVNQILSQIEQKIINSQEFENEFVKLKNLVKGRNNINISFLENLIQNPDIRIKNIILKIYEDESLKDSKISTNFFSFDNFKKLFHVKNTKDNIIYLSDHQINSVILQLLIEGQPQAAYIIAIKYSLQNDLIHKLAMDLEPITKTLAAIDSLKKMIYQND